MKHIDMTIKDLDKSVTDKIREWWEYYIDIEKSKGFTKPLFDIIREAILLNIEKEENINSMLGEYVGLLNKSVSDYVDDIKVLVSTDDDNNFIIRVSYKEKKFKEYKIITLSDQELGQNGVMFIDHKYNDIDDLIVKATYADYILSAVSNGEESDNY